jgi:hypothetical protein
MESAGADSVVKRNQSIDSRQEKMMKLIILFLVVSGCFAAAQENVMMEEQSNEKAERQLVATGQQIIVARDQVIKTIGEIPDQKKRELYKSLFEKNEKAWADFIGATALLQQPIKDSSSQPDVRYTRILGANYSSFRMKQYHDFVIWMK